jgi:alpha-L-fucosidase
LGVGREIKPDMRSLIAGFAVLILMSMAGAAEPFGALPTKQQVKWQDGELTLFLHFGVNTFTDREWGDGKEDEKIFNPTELDATQWAKAAKAGGFTLAILTAKHHDGFCLWPSKLTEHSVKNSPWKNGKGDVVREFVNAFRAEGIRVGLYLSPWDRHEKSYGDSPAYNKYYMAQLTELLTQYGDIAEVWFDGANGEGPNGKKQVYDFPAYWGLVRKLQPDALMFSDAGPDIRWIGNEQGFAGEENWSTVDPKIWVEPGKAAGGRREANDSLQHGNKGGTAWRQGECDVSIRPGWFWHQKEDGKVRSVENLMDLYFKSVGRNSLLLLNVPPNKKGLLSNTDVHRLKEFKDVRDRIFKVNLLEGKKGVDLNGGLEFDLGKPEMINVAMAEEDIALGQRVEAYRWEYWDGSGWKLMANGTTIGHKKLDRFAAAKAQKVRLVVEKTLAPVVWKAMGIYGGE